MQKSSIEDAWWDSKRLISLYSQIFKVNNRNSRRRCEIFQSLLAIKILKRRNFYTPWKLQKIFDFLMFSGGIEIASFWCLLFYRWFSCLILDPYLTLHAPCISNICIKVKINLNFYFHIFFKTFINYLRYYKEVWKSYFFLFVRDRHGKS